MHFFGTSLICSRSRTSDMASCRQLWRALKRTLGLGRRQLSVGEHQVVLVTGCDSGLGHSLAVYCHQALNMTVISCCHNLQSQGAQLLQQLNTENGARQQRMLTWQLDLLKPESIEQLQTKLQQLLHNSNYQLMALVNNAGVMCFGEFEWQLPSQIELQINCNLLGTMRLTRQLLPLLRQHRGRIINVTSHCGLHALPALAPYAASKAALRGWTDALRIELQQYDMEVVNFIPGSFVMDSNIAARQQQHAQQMLEAFSEEQLSYYGTYFTKFNEYLSMLSGFKAPNKLRDNELLSKFKDALTNTQPAAIYIHEPWRYRIYRWLFGICPTPLTDWLVVRFCAMPTYESTRR
ncbi:D-beta-hydroxybutyrate dehydrogenase, mitochondrial [Drosophila nasuta]|uniref:D-beta-hydroxybutyrate dehydrogenase, mitochondrial n=1 Tax=Drosophila nasuta TaxID=42062 RepID=UPI00295F29C3|nr:D-beta-hydroxybutyrate dehydrogenase, mitochondrial [Drosophila nasuta]